jgi:uncharacterized protein
VLLWPDPITFAVAALGIFVIAVMKGAFGGGFAIIGIPLLSLVLDPILAGAVLAPLFVVMDLYALRYWRPSTWSRPDARVLVPAFVVGIGIGYLTMTHLDRRLITIVMALTTLGFALHWLIGGGQLVRRERSWLKGTVCGIAGGITTMVAHAGGPPLAMYLLPLGLDKALYAGTTSLTFTVGNIVKIGPWLWLAQPKADAWLLMALCLPFVPLGVTAGWAFHERLNQQQMYRACYGLLIVVGVKLLWDGVRAYL